MTFSTMANPIGKRMGLMLRPRVFTGSDTQGNGFFVGKKHSLLFL